MAKIPVSISYSYTSTKVTVTSFTYNVEYIKSGYTVTIISKTIQNGNPAYATIKYGVMDNSTGYYAIYGAQFKITTNGDVS